MLHFTRILTFCVCARLGVSNHRKISKQTFFWVWMGIAFVAKGEMGVTVESKASFDSDADTRSLSVLLAFLHQKRFLVL
jgi:hypothetical protein